MTVSKLIAELQKHPGDWPVHFVTKSWGESPEVAKVFQHAVVFPPKEMPELADKNTESEEKIDAVVLDQ